MLLSYRRLTKMQKEITAGKPLADLQMYRETIKRHDGIGDALIPDSTDVIELGNNLSRYIRTRKAEKRRNVGVGGTLLAGAFAAMYVFTPVGDYVSSKFSDSPKAAVSQESPTPGISGRPSMEPIIRGINDASQGIEEKAVEGGKSLERSKERYVRNKKGKYTVPFNKELEVLEFGDRPLLDVTDLSLDEGEVVIYAIDPSQSKEKVIYQITLVGEAFKQFKEYSDTKKNLFDNKFYLFIPSDGKIRFDHHLTGRQPAAVCSSLAEMLDPVFMEKVEKGGMDLDGRYLPITIDDLDEGLRFSDYASFDPKKKDPAEVIKAKTRLEEREKELEKRVKSWKTPSTEDPKNHDKLNAKIDRGYKDLGSRIDSHDSRLTGVESGLKGVKSDLKTKTGTIPTDIPRPIVPEKPKEIDNFEPWNASYGVKDIEFFPDGDMSIQLSDSEYTLYFDSISGPKWSINRGLLEEAEKAGNVRIKLNKPESGSVDYDRKNKKVIINGPEANIIDIIRS